MKMADGGFRPAFNGQFAVDTKTRVVLGVDVTNIGSDMGQMPPMVEQLEARYGTAPDEILVDGGFAALDAVEKVTRGKRPTTVYAPLPPTKDPERDPYLPLPGDSPEVGAWRVRMGTEEAKAAYRERASTVECVNALARNRGLWQFLVRGVRKVRAVLLLHALTQNMMCSVTLRRPTLAGT